MGQASPQVTAIRKRAPLCEAEFLGDRRFRLTHPCGHSRVRDYSRGKHPMGKMGAKWIARIWERDGVRAGWCKRCYPDHIDPTTGLR
jgi:hypothetical protein